MLHIVLFSSANDVKKVVVMPNASLYGYGYRKELLGGILKPGVSPSMRESKNAKRKSPHHAVVCTSQTSGPIDVPVSP